MMLRATVCSLYLGQTITEVRRLLTALCLWTLLTSQGFALSCI